VANRVPRRLRSLSFILAVTAALLLVPAVAAALPGRPVAPSTRTIHNVQHRLRQLTKRNAILVDAYDRAQEKVAQRQAAATKAQQQAVNAQHQYVKAEQELQIIMAAEYEGGSFSAAGALLSSPSGESYINSLDTLSMLSSHSAQIVSAVAEAKKAAKAAQQKAQQMLAQAKSAQASVAKQKTHVKAQIAKFRNLLTSLTIAQQRAFAAEQAPKVTHAQVHQARVNLKNVHATSAAAAAAVKFALAQVGKPYEIDQSGPGGYDCSGLTMASWHAGGVNLPHSAAQQYNYGHHVSFSDLEPGDLLFYYSPIGHVTIYVGNGLMVSAPESGEDVAVIPDTSYFSSYVGATRLVG
jgi:cell wall-associated NlpC family hydrolase